MQKNPHFVVPEAFREKVKLTPGHRKVSYAVIGAIWGTGLMAVALRYIHLPWREPSDLPPSWDPVVMRIHGAAAMAFLALIGTLYGHMTRAWALRMNRVSGGIVLGLCVFFGVTGWLLYYSGSEDLRNAVSLAHWVVGLGFPLPLVAHIALGRARKPRAALTPVVAAPGLIPDRPQAAGATS